MERSTVSDSQLVFEALQRVPWTTLCLVLSQTIVFFITTLGTAEPVFGLSVSQTSLQKTLALDVHDPGRMGGLTFLTSFFVHADAKHFLSNIVWLLPFSFLMERQKMKLTALAALLAGHLVSVFGTLFLTQNPDAPRYIVGMSGGVVTLSLVWLTHRNAYWGSLAAGVLILLYMSQGMGSVLSHSPCLLLGLLWGFWLHKKKPGQQVRSGSSL